MIVKKFETHGFPAMITKHPDFGHLCGYLALPENHPYFDKQYYDIIVDIHGGWTYSADHAPTQKPDGFWWIGFDCAHVGDLVPGIDAITNGSFPGDVYRDETFVEQQLNDAAQELSKATEV